MDILKAAATAAVLGGLTFFSTGCKPSAGPVAPAPIAVGATANRETANSDAPDRNAPSGDASAFALPASAPPALQLPRLTPQPAPLADADVPPAPESITSALVATNLPNTGPAPAPASVKDAAGATPTRRWFAPPIPRLAAAETPRTTPYVALSDAHRKLCLVQAGDTFPALSLVDSQDRTVALPTLYGQRLTIVVFWASDRALAREQYERLEREVVGRYAVSGVHVVAVRVGESTDAASASNAASGGATNTTPSFADLADPRGEAVRQLASDRFSRTYLLDRHGKILWFDLEYSRGSRRDLDNAVHFFLSDAT